MTMRDDAYWDELGVAWRAMEVNNSVTTGRLHSRVRRQSIAIVAALAIGLPLCGGGFFVGIATMWSGWANTTWNFITRGFAIVMISAITARTLSLLLPVRASAEARALPEMLRLAIRRAERTLTIVGLSFWACGIAAVFGLAGTALRTHQSRPPALSPLIDMAVVAITAIGLFLYRRNTKVTLAKFQYLQKAIASDPSGGAQSE